MYRRWKKRQDVVLRQEHHAGEKLFVDWAGATIPIHHADGSVTQAPLFVSALGVSSYTYAEATPNQQMEQWLKVQMNALEFYGGGVIVSLTRRPNAGLSPSVTSAIDSTFDLGSMSAPSVHAQTRNVAGSFCSFTRSVFPTHQ